MSGHMQLRLQPSATTWPEGSWRIPQKTAGGPCDELLTSIFGDPSDAIAAGSGYEPSNLPDAYPGARDRSQAFGDKPSGWGTPTWLLDAPLQSRCTWTQGYNDIYSEWLQSDSASEW